MSSTHPLPTPASEPGAALRFPASYWRGLMVVTLFIGLAWINLSRVGADAATADRIIAAPQVGFLAPDFTLPTTEGETVTLSSLRGKPVILNFWATWCPPCRAEMPAFEDVWQRTNRGDVAILGINQGETKTAVERFARDYIGVTFPLVLDARTEVGKLYAVRALPTTVFIDPEGRIQDIKVGGPLDQASILSGIGKAQTSQK